MTENSDENIPKQYKILIAVVSSPLHFEARKSIKESWGSVSEMSGIPVRFFVGIPNQNISSSQEEWNIINKRINNEENVIRFDNFIESYHNLTRKAISIFSWAWENGYKAILKVDDDSFVRIPKLLEFLNENENILPQIYAGQFLNGTKAAVLNPKSKWYMYDQYPFTTWPDYANGPGFILGSKALSYIYSNRDSLPLYRVDDAAVGIWLQNQNLQHVNMNCDSNEWKLSEDSVWVNPVNKDEMALLLTNHKFVLQSCITGRLCEGGPYEPDWSEFSSSQYEDIIPR